MRRWLGLVPLVLALGCSGAPVTPDGGADAGADAGLDSGVRDSGAADSGAPDAGAADAGEPDAGPGPRRWGTLQWPPFLGLDAGARALIYGQVWVEGRTEAAGAAAGLEAQLGLGPLGSAPWGAGWVWAAAAFNLQSGSNDEFQAELVAPATGTHDYAFRYRLPGAWTGWIYADRSDGTRKGTDDGYQPEHAGKLAVRAMTPLKVATLNLHGLNDNWPARLDAAATRFAALGVDAVCLQEVCVDASVNLAQELAARLGARTGRPFGWRYEQTHLANNVTPEGLAVVTALPIVEARVDPLPTADFPRKLLTATLLAPQGPITFSSTHFSFAATATQARLDQANAVAGFLDGLAPAAPRALCGDFNAVPTEGAIGVIGDAGFTDAWAARNGAAPGFTHRSDSPTRRIDYVFVRGLNVDSAALEFDQPYDAGAWVSDHCGVSARLSRP